MLPEPNARIVRLCSRYLTGDSSLIEAIFCAKPGYCLRVLRQIIQLAFDIDYDEFQARYRTHISDGNPDPVNNTIARDVQRSLRMQRLNVARSELLPGDLYFNHQLGAPDGHCGIIYSVAGDVVTLIENTGGGRGLVIFGYNHHSLLSMQPYAEAMEFFRLPEV